MSIERRSVDVAVAHTVTVQNEFAYHDGGSNRLLVILPGQAYLPSHPVLHYLKKGALLTGYDVLSVQYGFQVAPTAYAYDTIDRDMLLEEARRPFRAVVDRGYKHICFAGKSMSSPVAVALCGECPVQETRLILLTPIDDAIVRVGNIETLVIAGTADPLFRPDDPERDKRPNVRWCVLDDLNHGLEVEDDWRASITALEKITAACVDFLGEMGSKS